MPFKVTTGAQWKQALIVLLMIGGMILLGAGLISENIYILTVSGLGICAFLLFGFIVIQRSKNFDNRMKRMSYIFVIPFLSILAVVIMKWMES